VVVSGRPSTSDPGGNALPKIVVKPPGSASRQLTTDLTKLEPAPLFGASDDVAPIAWRRARGANVVDVDGNRYVDLTGGFGAALVGHRNRHVVNAVNRASNRLLHGLADAAPHRERVDLASDLSRLGPIKGGRVMFAGSGAEAIDIALKTAHLATGRLGVVAFHGGYHGTSLGALRATGRELFRQPFEAALAPATLRVPFADCYRCPYRLTYPACGRACLDAALAEIDAWNSDGSRPQLGAWVVEPVLGREGVVVPPRGYLKALGEAARERRLVVIADEILTGGGRTGRWWAGGPLKPDVVAIGKGITGGLPLAATIGRRSLMQVWEGKGEARHAATFMAHPLAVAASRAALAEIARRDLPARARKIGRLMKLRLGRIARRHATLGDVRGVGAMWGLDVIGDPVTRAPDAGVARAVSIALAQRGYLALAGGLHGNVLSLTPPLTISERQLEGFFPALDDALTEVTTR
jgi:4-aminobutyrate aminotransferase/(S)-3-amino-2-methylpropionate transaminase